MEIIQTENEEDCFTIVRKHGSEPSKLIPYHPWKIRKTIKL